MQIFDFNKGETATADGDGWIVEGTDRTFQADVLEASMKVPVIVDFWAPWCGPCKQLTPLLEAAVKKARGAVKLVKINIDENPAIAGQLRVQSIPTVYAIFQGQPVDGFQGALPASEIDKFIERLPKGNDARQQAADMDALLTRGEEALAGRDLTSASQAFAQVLQMEPENTRALGGLAQVYIANGQLSEAEPILAMAGEGKDTDPAIAGARTALEFARKAADAPDIQPLLARAAAEPENFALRLEIAEAQSARRDFAGAVDTLLYIIERDRDYQDGSAREALLKVFEAAGATSPVTRDGRRRLSSILFS